MDLFEVAKNCKIELAPAVKPAPHQEDIKTPVTPMQKFPHRCRQRQKRKTKLKPSSNDDATNEEKSQEELQKEQKQEEKRRQKSKESMKIEELQSQMVTQSTQVTSLLGKVAKMIVQSKILRQLTKGDERRRV